MSRSDERMAQAGQQQFNALSAFLSAVLPSPAAANPDMSAATIHVVRPVPSCTAERRMPPIAVAPPPPARPPGPEATDPDEIRSWCHSLHFHLVWRRRTGHIHFRRGLGNGSRVRRRRRAITVNGSFTHDTPRQQERGAGDYQNWFHYFFIHNTHETRRTIGCIQSDLLVRLRFNASTGLDALNLRLLRIICNSFVHKPVKRRPLPGLNPLAATSVPEIVQYYISGHNLALRNCLRDVFLGLRHGIRQI